MKNIILLLALSVFCNVNAQFLSKKKGQLILKNGETINCFIRDFTWKRSPKTFRYKMDKNEAWSEVSIKDLKEMTLSSGTNFLAVNVEIDNSSNEVKQLDRFNNEDAIGRNGKDFKLKKEYLLLKRLVVGNANLYESNHMSIQKFFYNTSETKEIVQLLHKRYLITKTMDTQNDRISNNNYFLRQIAKYVSCEENLDFSKLLPYNKRKLVKHFEWYNINCQ